MVTDLQIHWLAGLLEGEGSFSLVCQRCPVISYGTVDHDSAYRVCRILNTHIIFPTTKTVTGKQIYRVSISGRRAIGWMLTVYILMGERRRSRIREVLNIWKAQKLRRQA